MGEQNSFTLLLVLGWNWEIFVLIKLEEQKMENFKQFNSLNLKIYYLLDFEFVADFDSLLDFNEVGSFAIANQ